MGALDLLTHFRERGLSIEPSAPGLLKVHPSSKLTAADRSQIKAHKAELLEVLTSVTATPESPARIKATTSCATCAHATKSKTCSEPEAAGLVDRFRVVWLNSLGSHGTTCNAHRLSEQRQPSDDVPQLTAAQQRAVAGWDDAEIATAGWYKQQAIRHGFEVEIAERITDHLILRDRRNDTRRMCLECAHLNPGGRCGAARTGHLAGAGRDLEPVKVLLMTCQCFESTLEG